MSMRAGPASRDASFRGIDTDALGHLITQLRTASSAIDGWLASHPAPVGVSSPGYRQAAAVQLWIADQLGMLTRRRNYALSHRDEPDISPVTPPAPSPPVLVKNPKPGKDQPITPVKPVKPGAGPDLGQYPTTQAAVKAGASDALAVKNAVQHHDPVPHAVWKNLAANVKDPDYTAALYQRLGPEGTARLLDAAEGDKARIKALTQTLAAAQQEHPMNTKWVAAFLAEAEKLGVRPAALDVLAATPLQPRVDDAVALLDARLTGAKG